MRNWLTEKFANASGPYAIFEPPVETAAALADSPLEAAAIETDANGSPLSIPAATWLICFVPGLRRQWWHRFCDARHKHVFALRSLGDGTWLLVEPWWTRMMVTVLPLDQAVVFLRWGALGSILRVRESIPGKGTQMRGWANCSVLMAFMLGRSYWTWTPNGLFRKLRLEPEVEEVDTSRLFKGLIQDEVMRHANAVLMKKPTEQDGRLDERLIELGTALVTAIVSPSAISLHKVAIANSAHFADAAAVYWELGQGGAIEHIQKVLLDARKRGEVNFDNCTTAARHLLGMLLGNFQLEIALGLRSAPSSGEVVDHVTFVVTVFLFGLRRERSLLQDAPSDAGERRLPRLQA